MVLEQQTLSRSFLAADMMEHLLDANCARCGPRAHRWWMEVTARTRLDMAATCPTRCQERSMGEAGPRERAR